MEHSHVASGGTRTRLRTDLSHRLQTRSCPVLFLSSFLAFLHFPPCSLCLISIHHFITLTVMLDGDS